MNKKIEITYWWKCENFPNGIPKGLEDPLEQAAEERIKEMQEAGYVSGDMNAYVFQEGFEGKAIPKSCIPSSGFHCRGWFDIVKTDVEPKATVVEPKKVNVDELIIMEHLEYFKQGLIRNGAPSTIGSRQVEASCGFMDSFRAFRSAFKKGMNLRELSSRD